MYFRRRRRVTTKAAIPNTIILKASPIELKTLAADSNYPPPPGSPTKIKIAKVSERLGGGGPTSPNLPQRFVVNKKKNFEFKEVNPFLKRLVSPGRREQEVQQEQQYFSK
jgi:hypothetical protein